VKTYNDVYLDARRRLKAAGIEAFTLEARLIVGGAAGKTKEQLLKDLNLYAGEEFARKVDKLIDRRIAGEPVAHITGEWEFYGVPIMVTPDVLIPRVDTELIAELAIKLLKGREGGATRILDLCAGSGCIGIAVASNVSGCRMILADKSLKAISVCRQNVNKNNLSRRITCVEADALKNPPMLLGKFDMIICNPPYIPSADIMGLDPSVRDYEPVEALDGGESGLEFFKAIASKWKDVLKPNGCLMFECGAGQADDVEKIMKENGFTQTKKFIDTLEIERVVVGLL
jgi:release factor glutamine methyltransferase